MGERIIRINNAAYKHAHSIINDIAFYSDIETAVIDGRFIEPERMRFIPGCKTYSEFRRKVKFWEIDETARKMYKESLISIALDEVCLELEDEGTDFYVVAPRYQEVLSGTSFCALSRKTKKRFHGTGLENLPPVRLYRNVHLVMPLPFFIIFRSSLDGVSDDCFPA